MKRAKDPYADTDQKSMFFEKVEAHDTSEQVNNSNNNSEYVIEDRVASLDRVLLTGRLKMNVL